MASVRRVLAFLEGRSRAMWDDVAELGKIRRRTDRAGKTRFYLDFRPIARVYSDRGEPFDTWEQAHRALTLIRGLIVKRRCSLQEALSEFAPSWSKPHQVSSRLAAWLEVKRTEMEAGRLSPGYVEELDRYAAPEGHFSFLASKTIHDLTYAVLEDWLAWLGKRGLAPASQRNVLAGFHSFMSWLVRRGEMSRVPEFPTVRVPEFLPRLINTTDQEAILQAIPWERRGPFLAMAYLGIRPSEARALRVSDVEGEWLVVRRAAKGSAATAPVRGTKTGRVKRLPIPPELAEWIADRVDPRGRLTGALLFPNPQTGKMYGAEPLRRTWGRACDRVGISVPLYSGTKHSTATALRAAGVDDRVLQRLLGHSRLSSTERYARLQDGALVTALGKRPVSPACPQTEKQAEPKPKR